MEIKEGVKMEGLQPELIEVAEKIIEKVFNKYGFQCVITSALDGKHSKNSYHYSGNALDFRSRHVTNGWLACIVDDIKKLLPVYFDLVVEASHLHLEKDLKKFAKFNI